MRQPTLFLGSALTVIATIILAAVMLPSHGHSEVLKLVNGDRYHGRVVRVDETRVILESEVQGKLELPRSKVTHLKILEGFLQKTEPRQTAPTQSKEKAESQAKAKDPDQAQDDATDGSKAP